MQNGSVVKHSLTPAGVLHFKELTCKTLTLKKIQIWKLVSLKFYAKTCSDDEPSEKDKCTPFGRENDFFLNKKEKVYLL